MHRWILGAALASVALPAARAQRPGCPGTEVLERMISADCPDCWSTASASPPPAGAWLFDWIVPSAAGADAPLSAAAPVEARERLQRSRRPPPSGRQGIEWRRRLPDAPPWRLELTSGPAWHGYIGAQLSLAGRAPPGATGWLALVEALAAGSEGNPGPRELVRTVAGPLSLRPLPGEDPLLHWNALRIPQMAQADRLRVRGWIEAADGRMLGVASEACPAGRPAPR